MAAKRRQGKSFAGLEQMSVTCSRGRERVGRVVVFGGEESAEGV